MKASDLKTKFRNLTSDVEAPYLWSDAELWGYLTEAYNQMVRGIGGLRDAASEVTQVVVPAEVEIVDIDPRIISLLAARDADGRPLSILDWADPEAKRRGQSGTVRAIVLGETENTLRAIDIPTVDTQLYFIVRRMPLTGVKDGNTVFELRDDHAEHLVYGALARAYLKDDPETYDKRRADMNEARFLSYVAQAKQDLQTRGMRTRVVEYGGL